MELWMSSEADKKATRIVSKLDILIEDKINEAIKKIDYINNNLKSLDIILVIRNDNFFDEIIKYRKNKKDTDFRLKIDYDTFINASEKERKNLILDILLRSLNILEEKGIDNLEPIKSIIEEIRDGDIG